LGKLPLVWMLMFTENVEAKILGCPDHVLGRNSEPEHAQELQVGLPQPHTPAATSDPAPARVSQEPTGRWVWGHQCW